MNHDELLHDGRILRAVEIALMEDIGVGDITSDAIIPETDNGVGEFLCKGTGVAAGLDVVALVFQLCDETSVTTANLCDGDPVTPGIVLALVRGKTKAILRGERTALNFLQRMSGIATATRNYVKAVEGTGAKITDTRKTAPGLRNIDKWAVRCGGGVNHRFGLDDMILIKDNHIAAAGGITKAVTACLAYLGRKQGTIGVEVETKTLQEVDEALSCTGITRIMLDNFAVPDMRRAVQRIGRRMEVEASGGITLETVRAVAETGVDFISVGALTHSVRGLDISLELIPAHHDHSH
jgi:nicotinate-nucleotide pyrophosphorylase (carboxylating)